MREIELAVAETASPTAEENVLRHHIAMAYRLIGHFDLTTLTDGFVSARASNAEREIILGRYGALPALVRASDLHRRNLDSALQIEKADGVDVDAMCFSRMVYDTCPEFNAVIHAHPKYGMIFSSMDCELDCISQYSLMFKGLVGYIDWHSADVSGDAMRKQIVGALEAGKRVIVLRNHGFLIPGRTVAEAVWTLIRMEETAMVQIEAMKTGAPLKKIPDDIASDSMKQYWDEPYIDNDGTREWSEFERMLDRMDPSYRD
ncbi:MAG: class II aldolase/adducin family protein [Pseudomonadota bacterium]